MKNNYHLKLAAIALMISDAFWLIVQLSHLFFQVEVVNNQMLLSFFLPVGLIFTSIILMSKRAFSQTAAWSLIILSVVWSFRDMFKILDSYPLLSLSFNLLLLIDLLVVIVPVALLVTGFYLALNKSDRTVPACLLFTGSFLWILSIVLNITHLFINQGDAFNISLELANLVVITVPVSLIFLARALLVKKTAPKEVENKWVESVEIEKPVPAPPVVRQATERKIVFLREDRDSKNVWVIYQASTKADAVEFLSDQMIDRPSYYVVVETPEGNFGKDENGVYQE